MNNEIPDNAIVIENENHVLYPGQKTEFVKIEYLDIRKNIYTEGDTVEKTKAMALVKQGLAKLKLVSKPEKSEEAVRCKWTCKAMKGRYEGNICHMPRSKAERLQSEGVLRIVEGLPY